MHENNPSVPPNAVSEIQSVWGCQSLSVGE